MPMILGVILLTAVLLIAYEIAIRMLWQPMFWIYFVALSALLVCYVVYNRGFTRTRVSRNCVLFVGRGLAPAALGHAIVIS